MRVNGSQIFHLIEVPLLAAGATATAVLAPDFVIIFAITFLLIAAWITTLPLFRGTLDGMALRCNSPELFTPAGGVPPLLRMTRGVHVLLYALYGGLTLAYKDRVELTALLWSDWACSVLLYATVRVRAREASGMRALELSSVQIPGDAPDADAQAEAAGAASEPRSQLPFITISFPRVDAWLQRF